jgi:hypothetical protein
MKNLLVGFSWQNRPPSFLSMCDDTPSRLTRCTTQAKNRAWSISSWRTTRKIIVDEPSGNDGEKFGHGCFPRSITAEHEGKTFVSVFHVKIDNEWTFPHHLTAGSVHSRFYRWSMIIYREERPCTDPTVKWWAKTWSPSIFSWKTNKDVFALCSTVIDREKRPHDRIFACNLTAGSVHS